MQHFGRINNFLAELILFITKNGLEKHGKSHATPLLNKSRKK